MAVLIGTNTTPGANDFFGNGDCGGSRYQAAASGNVDTLRIAVRTGSSFTSLKLAIYADSSGVPGAKLGETGTITNNTAGVKSATLGTPVAVASGTFYWLFVLPTGGSLNFTGGTGNAGYRGRSLGAGVSTFPDPWTTAGNFTDATVGLPIQGESTGGGTTQVTSSRRVVYSVQKQVTSTRRINYNVLAQVAATRRVRYNVLAQVSASRRVRYDVIAAVVAQRRIVYNVAASTSQVSATRRVVYNVQAQVAASRRIRYNVLASVTATRRVTYNVAQAAIATRRIVYTVQAQVAASRRVIYTVFDGAPPIVVIQQIGGAYGVMQPAVPSVLARH